ncbi:hypothetical protein [Gabonibacter chumensis]|uniref:hypothetical protein n=1 Tax=Gabonibacter chumensis TaxID=2972474 RepID=UPI0025730209|nr:hypothetical protein [Gabonibacter chumensis]MCR9010756.1 hypothetical protein [Gabonibacter chumensis]
MNYKKTKSHKIELWKMVIFVAKSIMMNAKSVFIQLKDNAIKKKSKCMFPGCSCEAISYSHVFQKNKILNQLVSNGHLMIFDYKNDGECIYRSKGVNKAFTFKGLCQKHDNDLFASIEKEEPNWFDTKSQYLLGYKSICREFAIKQIAVEINSEFVISLNKGIETDYIKVFNRDVDPEFVKSFKENTALYQIYRKKLMGEKLGLSDFQTYKEHLEHGIINKSFEKFEFTTIELPFKLEVCISSPISNSYSEIPNEDIARADLPEMNVINIFPYQNKTMVIIGSIKGFPNTWANKFINKLKSGNQATQLKAISDLIVYRCEFHCMSESLFRKIGEEKFQQYYNLFRRNLYTMRDIDIDFNLFENCFEY